MSTFILIAPLSFVIVNGLIRPIILLITSKNISNIVLRSKLEKYVCCALYGDISPPFMGNCVACVYIGDALSSNDVNCFIVSLINEPGLLYNLVYKLCIILDSVTSVTTTSDMANFTAMAFVCPILTGSVTLGVE